MQQQGKSISTTCYFISLGFRQSEIATKRLFATSTLKNLTISAGAWLVEV